MTIFIPNKLHFIWHDWCQPYPPLKEPENAGAEHLSTFWKQHYDAWVALHPTWEVTIWNEFTSRQLIETQYPWFLRTYDFLPYSIQRVDAARVFILLSYGGVYSDLDIKPETAIDSWITEANNANADIAAVASFGFPACVTNSFIASPPGSNTLWYLATKIFTRPLPWWALTKHLAVMASCGPLTLTEAIFSTNTHNSVVLFPRGRFKPFDLTADDEKNGLCHLGAPVLGTFSEDGDTAKSWNSIDSQIGSLFRTHQSLMTILVTVFILFVIAAVIWMAYKCWERGYWIKNYQSALTACKESGGAACEVAPIE
jgi:hypothetical protein